MNGLNQLSNEGHFAPERDNRAELFDLIISKGMQLQGLLALMIHSAVDDEVMPAHRLATCQIAWDLTSVLVCAASDAINIL